MAVTIGELTCPHRDAPPSPGTGALLCVRRRAQRRVMCDVMMRKRVVGWRRHVARGTLVLALAGVACGADDSRRSDASSDAGGGADVSIDRSSSDARLGDLMPDSGSTDIGAADVGDGAASDGGAAGPSARWVSLGAPTPGYVSALAVAADGTVFAGVGPMPFTITDASGVFTSGDSGSSWQPRNDGLRDFTVRSFALSAGLFFTATSDLVRSLDGGLTWTESLPSDSDGVTVVASDPTGSLVFAVESNRPEALLRSEDGGVNWTLVRNPAATFDMNAVAVLGSVVLAYGDEGLARSTDRGETFRVVPEIRPGFPAATNTTYLLCGQGRCLLQAWSATGNGMVLRSTDEGATWNPVGAKLFAPFAMTRDGTTYAEAPGNVMARSDDGGDTWITVPAPPLAPHALAADQTDVYAATTRGVFHSHDKGLTWSSANGTVAAGALTTKTDFLFVDTSSSASSPNGDLYVAASGTGLLRSIDDGASWSVVNESFRPWSCVVTEATGMTCTGRDRRLYPISVRSTDHGVTWKPWSVPAFAQAPFMDELYAVAAHGETVYVSGKRVDEPRGQVARSRDGGLTFELLPNGPEVSELQVLPNGHVFGYHGILGPTYSSADDGASWKELATTVSLPVTADDDGVLYRGLGYSPEASRDDGESWQTIKGEQPQELLGRSTRAMWFDGGGTLYRVTRWQPSASGGRRPWDLWTSNDRGQHWAAFPARLPHPVVEQTAIDKRGRLLVGTNGGVYRLEQR